MTKPKMKRFKIYLGDKVLIIATALSVFFLKRSKAAKPQSAVGSQTEYMIVPAPTSNAEAAEHNKKNDERGNEDVEHSTAPVGVNFYTIKVHKKTYCHNFVHVFKLL